MYLYPMMMGKRQGGIPLSSLAVGAKIKDPATTCYGVPIVWQIADKNHSGYPANSATIISEKILTIKCFDAKEPSNSNSNRKQYGNNRYIYSNIDSWLNSSAGKWYTPQHSADAPPTAANCYGRDNPYDTQAGFLSSFSANFQAALLPTTLIVAMATADGGGSETLTRNVFLASKTETGLADENNIAEGVRLALFGDNASLLAYPTPQAVSNSNYANASLKADGIWNWWLRTSNSATPDGAIYVNTDGTAAGSSVYIGRRGIRPLCNLSSTLRVTEELDSDGCHTIIWR